VSIAISSLGQTPIAGEGQPGGLPKITPPTKRTFVAASDAVAQPEPR
jgi:hypothetical protein